MIFKYLIFLSLINTIYASDQVLTCPDIPPEILATCYDGEVVGPIEERKIEEYQTLLANIATPYAETFQESLVASSLELIKRNENEYLNVFPDLKSFEDDPEFQSCKKYTESFPPNPLSNEEVHIQKHLLLGDQINGALISKVVFSQREKMRDRYRAIKSDKVREVRQKCREDSVNEQVCVVREQTELDPINAALSIELQEYENITAAIFQQYPMLFETYNRSEIIPIIELTPSDYQNKLLESFDSSSLADIEFDPSNKNRAIEQIQNAINSDSSHKPSAETLSKKRLPLLVETEKAVKNHLEKLKGSAINICDEDSNKNLHHSDALVSFQLNKLKSQGLSRENFAEEFQKLQVGFCQLSREHPRETGISTTTIVGGGIVAVGVAAQLIPVAGNLAGSAAILGGISIVAGSGILAYESFTNFQQSSANEEIVIGLQAAGLANEDFLSIRDAIRDRRFNGAMLLSEVVLAPVGALKPLRGALGGARTTSSVSSSVSNQVVSESQRISNLENASGIRLRQALGSRLAEKGSTSNDVFKINIDSTPTVLKVLEDRPAELGRELAAFNVDRLFGINRVPVSAKSQNDNLLQEFIPDVSNNGPIDQTTQFFDYIIGNTDRVGNAGNRLVRENGDIVHIDHGNAFFLKQNSVITPSSTAQDISSLLPSDPQVRRQFLNTTDEQFNEALRPLLEHKGDNSLEALDALSAAKERFRSLRDRAIELGLDN